MRNLCGGDEGGGFVELNVGDRENPELLEQYRNSDWFCNANGEGFEVGKGGDACKTMWADWFEYSEIAKTWM